MLLASVRSFSGPSSSCTETRESGARGCNFRSAAHQAGRPASVGRFMSSSKEKRLHCKFIRCLIGEKKSEPNWTEKGNLKQGGKGDQGWGVRGEGDRVPVAAFTGAAHWRSSSWGIYFFPSVFHFPQKVHFTQNPFLSPTWHFKA